MCRFDLDDNSVLCDKSYADSGCESNCWMKMKIMLLYDHLSTYFIIKLSSSTLIYAEGEDAVNQLILCAYQRIISL